MFIRNPTCLVWFNNGSLQSETVQKGAVTFSVTVIGGKINTLLPLPLSSLLFTLLL